MLLPKDARHMSFVFEGKKAGNDSQESLTVTAQTALGQIEAKAAGARCT